MNPTLVSSIVQKESYSHIIQTTAYIQYTHCYKLPFFSLSLNHKQDKVASKRGRSSQLLWIFTLLYMIQFCFSRSKTQINDLKQGENA